MKKLTVAKIQEVVDFNELVAIDEIAVTEYELQIENDAYTYRRLIQPNIANLAKKMKRDEFDYNKGVLAFYHIVTDYLRSNQELDILKVHDRIIVANYLLESNMDEIEELSKMMSIGEIRDRWNDIKATLPKEFKKDTVAMKQEFMLMVDGLNKDGLVSDEIADNIQYK